MLREARSSRTERRCGAGGSSDGVAVVLGGPAGDVAARRTSVSVARACRSHRNGPPVAGLVPAGELDRVVRDRRAEVRPPRGLAVVAVGARVGEDVDAAVADLHRQGVGVGVRGDAEEPVRAAVAPAPDLGALLPVRAEQRSSRRRRSATAAARACPRMSRGAGRQGADERAARAPAGDGGHQSSRPKSASPSASSDGQRLGTGASSSSARPSSASPWRGGAQPLVDQGRRAVRHRAQPLPGDGAQRVAAALGLDRGEEARARRRSTGSPRRARGRCPTGRCCGPARARAARADLRRQRSLSGNHGNAQLATSCPAASAMTWLLADEPRLRNAARYCWCQRICRTASASSLEQVGRRRASRRAGAGSRPG